MVKPKRQYILVGMLLILAIYIGFLVKFLVDINNRGESPGWGLPVVSIMLNDTTLEDINSGLKTDKYLGNSVTILNNGEANNYYDVELTGRGNTTWFPDKKPYQIKFEHKVDLFGLGGAKKWVLLADAYDDTHLRNDTAFFVERMLDEEYALDGQHVMLYVDGRFIGLYYLTEKIEIAKDRIDLKDPLGVLVEVDNLHFSLETIYKSKWGENLVMKESVNKDNEKLAMNDFLTTFNELEIAIEANDYSKIRQLIDVESFAKYYLLSEFTVNPDAYSTSWYLFKDGPNDKIHTGPGWDFDLALANKKWVWNINQDFFSPYRSRVREIEAFGGEYINEQNVLSSLEVNPTVSRLFYELMRIPEFNAEVSRIFNEKMSGDWLKLKNYVTRQATKLYVPVKQDANLWYQEDYTENVADLLEWLEKRYKHFEQTYGLNNI